MNSCEALHRYMEDIFPKSSALDLLRAFRPISVASDRLQVDSCPLGEFFEIWLDLRSDFPEKYIHKITNRSDVSPIFYVASILDHRFHGSRMDPTEVAKGLSYICESIQNLVPEVINYLAKYTLYDGCLFEDEYKNVTPGAWWGAGQKLGFSDDMIQFSMSLVTASPAMASLKRSFSTLGLTYGMLQAQVGHEKAGKIAFLFKGLNKL